MSPYTAEIGRSNSTGFDIGAGTSAALLLTGADFKEALVAPDSEFMACPLLLLLVGGAIVVLAFGDSGVAMAGRLILAHRRIEQFLKTCGDSRPEAETKSPIAGPPQPPI